MSPEDNPSSHGDIKNKEEIINTAHSKKASSHKSQKSHIREKSEKKQHSLHFTGINDYDQNNSESNKEDEEDNSEIENEALHRLHHEDVGNEGDIENFNTTKEQLSQKGNEEEDDQCVVHQIIEHPNEDDEHDHNHDHGN